MNNSEKSINYRTAATPKDLPKPDANLFAQAVSATKNAYAPYSDFRVGAAVLLADGTVVLGCNQENMAYPSGLCAERVAVFAAAAQYPNVDILSVAIAVDTPSPQGGDSLSPCGGCRQVLIEYERKQGRPIRLMFGSVEGPVTLVDRASVLLPFAFFDSKLSQGSL